MEFRDIFLRVRERIKKTREELDNKHSLKFPWKNIVDSISEDWIEKALQKAQTITAPSIDEIPLNLQLQKLDYFRQAYEKLFPISYAFRIRFRYGREYFDEFMPVTHHTFLGTGSYKYVYALPWKMVVKISKTILPSNPLFGSLYRVVRQNPDKFLTNEELQLYEYLSQKKPRWKKEYLWFQFLRLGLERYHYAIVKENLPDLIIPTRFFIGSTFRRRFWNNDVFSSIKPMDVQILLTGKHLKEFVKSGKRINHPNLLLRWIAPPKYKFEFDVGVFSNVKKKILVRIKEDFLRLIHFTEKLAKEKKLILDIHTENIIITIPEFELKLFDFHIFDEHLYEYDNKLLNPATNHIEVIEQFIESFDLE